MEENPFTPPSSMQPPMPPQFDFSQSPSKPSNFQKLAIFILAIVAIVILVALLMVVVSQKTTSDSDKKSNNHETAASAEPPSSMFGQWSCYTLAAFNQIYLKDGDKMPYIADITINQDNTYHLWDKLNPDDHQSSGTWAINAPSTVDDSLSEIINPEITSSEEVIYHTEPSSESILLHNYLISFFPENSDIETTDGQPYAIEISGYIPSVDSANYSYAGIKNSNNKNYFNAGAWMYCLKK